MFGPYLNVTTLCLGYVILFVSFLLIIDEAKNDDVQEVGYTINGSTVLAIAGFILFAEGFSLTIKQCEITLVTCIVTVVMLIFVWILYELANILLGVSGDLFGSISGYGS